MPAFNPNDPLGSDFGGIDDVDQNLTPVSGKLCVGQAVARRWITNPGELFYASDYGAGLRRYLNGSARDIATLPSRLESEAKKDQRVDDCKVGVLLAGEELIVTGRLVTAVGPFSLVFKLSATSQALEVIDA